MPQKVVKFEEISPQQRVVWFRIQTDDWPAPGSVFDPSAILARLAKAETSVAALGQALADAIGRIDVLEGILLSVNPGFVLGRHSATPGPAQEIEIGCGLALIGDNIISASGACGVASFTLECVTDFTDHEVTCVFEDGAFNLRPNQAVSGTGAVTGIDFLASDSTNHLLELVLEDGVYNVRVNQAVGGTGAVSSMVIVCASPVTAKSLSVVFEDGVYNWKLT